ncbi:MAG: hypothetical protein AB8F74_20210, partial [Saprospiraceae bacterium]
MKVFTDINKPLQKFLLIGFSLMGSLFQLSAQGLGNGCAEAGFGVDADNRSGISYFGSETSSTTTTDDWFFGTNGNGIGVIDTIGGWKFRQNLLDGENLVWMKEMGYTKNSVVNGYLLHDAAYARDYYGGSGTTDLTSYTQASKNGEDPADWDIGPHNVLGKNDLIDGYGHLRRDGATGQYPLWMYLGFSRIANSGSSYFDAELYVQPSVYSPSTGFGSGGPDDGHTAWQFDADGNVITVGDLVVTCDFSTVNAPVLGLRVWVSRYDFLNTNPVTFNFGNDFDGDGNAAVFGYADVEIPLNTFFGCALGNNSFSPAPPWGTLNTGGDYSNSYESNQFVEIGLNLTVIGIDP